MEITTPYQYLCVLEIEYIQARIRAMTYSSEKDVSYWKRVSEGKKTKIKQIALKHSLSCIFDSSKLELDLWTKILGSEDDIRYPDFHYSPLDLLNNRPALDFQEYYAIGSDVLYKTQPNDSPKQGVIINVKDTRITILSDQDEVVKITTKLCRRVFNN